MRATALLMGSVAAAGLLASCGSSESSPSSSGSQAGATGLPSSAGPGRLPPETLTFGVIGPSGEIAQYQTMAQTFVSTTRKVTVKVEGWPNGAAMLGAFRDGTKVPDVFLASRRHLPYLVQHQLVQPVDGLLDDRGFDFGDEFPHTSLTAFGSDNHLVCLPYGVEPAVVFYNKRLVKFGELKRDPITPGQGWSLAQFTTAARWAAHHHPGVAGAALDPTLMGVAPFVYSGGGQLFDSASQPTSLALSSSDNVQSLVQTVRALRAAGTTLTSAQLDRSSPEQWFERGKVAMLEGTRRMVPDLRAIPGLRFDVMPMPSLSTSATVGSLTGLCLSSHAKDVATAADFLAYASTPGALSLVAYGGYLQPANQTVALSDAFQQPGQEPRHASVFTFSVKSMVYPPSVEKWDDLELRVDPMIEQLLTGQPSQVPPLARQIDRASYRVIGPTYGPTANPSPQG